MGGCMVLWVGWWMGLSFDILIFDYLVKPPQPITGLFFKENDLIDCGADPQPIRLQVGTLCQSDYRCACRAACARVVCARVVCAGVAGTLSQSGLHAQGLYMQGLRAQWLHMQWLWVQGLHAQWLSAQGLCMQGWWGHSANQWSQSGLCVQGLCAQ